MASNHPHTLTGFITLSPLHQLAGVWWAFWRTMAAKFSWAFKMVSQFGSLGYTIMGKTADMTVVQKTPFTSRISHKHSLPKKLAVHRVLYPSMLSESWVQGKSVEEKDAQPSERTTALWGCQAKSIQEFGWTSQGMDWGWCHGIKSHHTQTCQGIWL